MKNTSVISEQNLAEIILALIVNPSLVNAPGSSSKRSRFINDIMVAATNYVGGKAVGSFTSNAIDCTVHADQTLLDLSGTAWDIESLSTRDAIKQLLIDPSNFSITGVLTDRHSDNRERGETTTVRLSLNENGIVMGFSGHSTSVDSDNYGEQLWVERYEGDVVVRAYNDINSDEPVNISLASAKNECRFDD